ncbi:MAG TPA: hypothetical protein VG735_01805 [Caulobacterales bacterium]|jgi:hypothetical protein|nr:hypothetical protein [Caulobacterales bacterium]
MNREPFSLQDAWQAMGDLYAAIVSLFGAPFDIAMQLILVRQNRRDILAWLGPVEALARRLLLLKALSMPTPNDAPAKAPPGRVLIAFADRAQEDIDPESEKWRVRFCVMPHGVLRTKRSKEPCADQRGGAINFNALPLARRLEALRRLLENPQPALARLRRLLATQRAAVESAFRPYRPRATCVQSALDDAQREIDLALNTS